MEIIIYKSCDSSISISVEFVSLMTLISSRWNFIKFESRSVKQEVTSESLKHEEDFKVFESHQKLFTWKGKELSVCWTFQSDLFNDSTRRDWSGVAN